MGNVKKSVVKRTRHKRQYDIRVNKRQMQMHACKVDSSKALDADLVVMESNGTKFGKHDTSSSSGNYLTHVVDEYIRPVNDQMPFADTKVEGSSKRAGKELESDNSKKKKIDEHVEAEGDDDQEEAEMKTHMEIVQDNEVAIDAIPLAPKPPVIVEWKIIKEGNMGYYQLIRANGSSKRYSSMIRMLQNINKEDLETLWKLVKAKHGNTRPEEAYESVLWGDPNVMFEPDVESEIWRNLQGYKVTVWKIFYSCGVHFVRFQNMHIFMLVEKNYPLTLVTITEMLNKKLQTNYWNEMCYELLNLMTKKLSKIYSSGINNNVLANEQQHTEQSEPIYDTYMLEKIDSNTTPDSTNMCHRGGEIDQDAEQYQVKSPLLNAEFFKMKDMVEKEVYNELSNRFLQHVKHCISLEISIQQKEESFQSNKPCKNQDSPKFHEFFKINKLKAQLQAKNSMINNMKKQNKNVHEKSKEAKVKHDIDVIETINIELDHKFAKLLKENETLKKHYKDLYDSIKVTRTKTIEQTTSLIDKNDEFKAQLQAKGFTITALKNELRKLKGNNMDTKFSKSSILGKPILQPPRNQSVVRQPNAFKSERPNFSKPRFASQVDMNNVLSKPVTPHYFS
ncbi:hypothetical protein Tco_0347562 [Tanacetum coccineum]